MINNSHATQDNTVAEDLFSCTKLSEIGYVERPSVEQFEEEFVRKNRPVILGGVADDWPCTTKWTLDYIGSRVGQVKVQKPSDFGIYHFLNFDRIPFQEFEESLRTTKDLYLSADPILTVGGKTLDASELTPLAPDVVFPPYSPKEEIAAVNLWIGPGGNKSLLHYDPWHSLLLMLSGRKRVAVFPASQTRWLYPYRVLEIKALYQGRVMDSKIDPQRVQLDRFKNVRKATGFRAELAKGQMLFLPAGTWHYVESIGLNIAINYFWNARGGGLYTKRPLREHWIKTRVMKAPQRLWNRFRSVGKWVLRK